MGAVCASVLVSSTGTGGIEGSADNSHTTRGRSSQPAARHSAGHSLAGLSIAVQVYVGGGLFPLSSPPLALVECLDYILLLSEHPWLTFQHAADGEGGGGGYFRGDL